GREADTARGVAGDGFEHARRVAVEDLDEPRPALDQPFGEGPQRVAEDDHPAAGDPRLRVRRKDDAGFDRVVCHFGNSVPAYRRAGRDYSKSGAHEHRTPQDPGRRWTDAGG